VLRAFGLALDRELDAQIHALSIVTGCSREFSTWLTNNGTFVYLNNVNDQILDLHSAKNFVFFVSLSNPAADS